MRHDRPTPHALDVGSGPDDRHPQRCRGRSFQGSKITCGHCQIRIRH
ncbi:hypothetical protein D779_2589 [Imhoffiella purpurea]|uniref:Uncharacterized protein n=1 Tax=Imhoffiella purpurea TaxID=1249627 RepID=W9V4K0_9GAMM|nr:hypothetical protein D779_2589 [Imhoffiella purpurea]